MKYLKELSTDKKFGYSIGVGLLIFLVYAIISSQILNDKFENSNIEKKVTIATIIGYIPGAKSPPNFKYKYNIFGQKHEDTHPIVSRIRLKGKKELLKYIGKRYYVRVVAGEPEISRLLIDKPVLDSLKQAPSNGWLENE